MEPLTKQNIINTFETAALQAYPVMMSRIKCDTFEEDWREIDINEVKREAFIKGCWTGFNFHIECTPSPNTV